MKRYAVAKLSKYTYTLINNMKAGINIDRPTIELSIRLYQIVFKYFHLVSYPGCWIIH